MKLLRATDVAEVLNCSVSQVYALKDAGQIPYCRIGGMIRFRPSDLEDLINDKVVRPAKHRKPSARMPQLRHLKL